MTDNYTLQDVLGILGVAPVFALVLFIPGYLAGLASNVFSFRERGPSERILLSLALSCAISPYLINILCRFLTVRTVSIFFLLLGVAFLIFLIAEGMRRSYRANLNMDWTTKAALGMVALWALICLVSLPDIQIGDRLYSTAATYDHSVRSAFIASAVRTGAPPANPFFFPGKAVPARYYYYWNVLCAIPAYITGANARVVLYASCLWSGLCLASIIPIYLKHFLEVKSKLRLTTLFGFALIAITGLDIIPILIIWLFPVPPFADMEWWDPTQVASWFDSLIWVPHHMASLVACLAGFLLLWKAVAAPERRSKAWLAVMAAAGFSSAAGLSVYVTFTFALFLTAWVAVLLIRRRFREAWLYWVVGLLTVAMSIGYLSDLRGQPDWKSAGATSFVAFSLRTLPPLFAAFPEALGKGLPWVDVSLHLLFIVPTLFLEFGIYFVVAVVRLKHDWPLRRQLSEPQKCLRIMAASALFVIVFLRSTVIGSNDLAWRGGSILQFVLLLWTASYLADRTTNAAVPKRSSLNRLSLNLRNPLKGSETPRFVTGHDFSRAAKADETNGALTPEAQLLESRTLSQQTPKRWPARVNLSNACIALILIGGLSSLYQLLMLRGYTAFLDKYGWQQNVIAGTGRDSFLIRSAFSEMDRTTAPNVIVQFNPESKLTIQNVLYSRYQLVDAFAPNCGTAFGGSLDQCRPIDAQLKRIFNPSAQDNPTPTDVGLICRSLKIDQLIVNASDPIWKMPHSWVWTETPGVKNALVRIYPCRAFPT